MNRINLTTGEIAPAERIGDSADGLPVYKAVAGWEPTTAFATDAAGNWIENRVEFRAATAQSR